MKLLTKRKVSNSFTRDWQASSQKVIRDPNILHRKTLKPTFENSFLQVLPKLISILTNVCEYAPSWIFEPIPSMLSRLSEEPVAYYECPPWLG